MAAFFYLYPILIGYNFKIINKIRKCYTDA